MKPIGPLMIEHRLIERMVELLKAELGRIQKGGKTDPGFIASAVDFFRVYADRTHHGKEEDILFRGLSKKSISQEHRRIMDKLLEEHVYARKKVGELAGAKNPAGVAAVLEELIRLYPAHIETEDRRFFIPSMEYFSKEEQEAMLQEFSAFDKKIIHDRYKEIVTGLESTRGKSSKRQ